MKIAVFLPNWIGDVVMSTPMLRALRGHFGSQATVTAVMKPYVAEVLAGTTWVDDKLGYDPKGKGEGLGTRELVHSLRRRSIDLAMVLPSSFRYAALAWLGGARRRIGYDRNGRGVLFTDRVPLPQRRGKLVTTPAVHLYLELAYRVGCPPQSPDAELATLPEDERQADRVFAALGLGKHPEIVILNPAGGSNSDADVRAWPAEHFAELANRVVSQYDVQVLVICGPREERLARRIAQLAGHRGVHTLADHRISIGPLKACIRRGRLIVTTDTGPRHLAAGLGVPSVALFGPTDPALSNIPRPDEIQLMRQLPCVPCGKRYCPLGNHACMRQLDVNTVFAAVERQLTDCGKEPSPRRGAA
jgi:heptosyltransferase-2